MLILLILQTTLKVIVESSLQVVLLTSLRVQGLLYLVSLDLTVDCFLRMGTAFSAKFLLIRILKLSSIY